MNSVAFFVNFLFSGIQLFYCVVFIVFFPFYFYFLFLVSYFSYCLVITRKLLKCLSYHSSTKTLKRKVIFEEVMDTSLLKRLGLTDNEIKIYIDLLKSGVSTASDISKRTTIYH